MKESVKANSKTEPAAEATSTFYRSCCGTCGHCHGHSGFRFVKGIVLLFLFAIIFAAGLTCGTLRALHWGSANYGYGMMGQGVFRGVYDDRYPGYMMSGNAWGKNNQDAPDRLFGTIEKIDGNKITVTDNAGEEKTVLTQSSTMILVSGVEISLSALKVGTTIISTGTLDADGQLTAKLIQVAGL